MEVAEIVAIAAIGIAVALFIGAMIYSLGQSDGRTDGHDKRAELRKQVEALQDKLTKEARHAVELQERIDLLEDEAKQLAINAAVSEVTIKTHQESAEALMNENRALWEAMKPSNVAFNLTNRNPVFMEPKEKP